MAPLLKQYMYELKILSYFEQINVTILTEKLAHPFIHIF